MRISLFAMGTQGDVQPYIALALALQHAGYQVQIVASDDFEGYVSSRGVPFRPLGIDARQLMESDTFRGLMDETNKPLAAIPRVVASVAPLADRAYRSAIAACAESDLLIFSLIGLLGYYMEAVRQGVPFVVAYPYPLFSSQTAEQPHFLWPIRLPPGLPLNGSYNRLTHWLVDQAFWQPVRAAAWALRRRGLPIAPTTPGGPARLIREQGIPVLMGFSPAVYPRPHDWPAHLHITGYWFLDRQPGWEPPADLLAFLEDGPPPVYVGFGSMTGRDPEQTAQIVLSALRRAGQRGVLLTGWGGIGAMALPDSVYVAEALPHDWLFPRMAAVVHHGGAGTTAAGLRAGVPTVTIPHFGDQPFWGERVHTLGVGPEPIPRPRLSADRLAYAIRIAATHRPMRERAAALGARIRAEDGVGQAVRLIEAFTKNGRHLRGIPAQGR